MTVRKCYWLCPGEGRRIGDFFCDSYSPTVQCPFLLILSVLHGILHPSEPNPSPHLSCFYKPVALHHTPPSITLRVDGPGLSPQYPIPLFVWQGKNWARDIRRTWLFCSQELERIISGKENKEGVEFLCWVCIRVKRTEMHVKCIHWYNITAHERAVHDVHWTVFSFLNTWSKVLLKVGFLLE